MKIQIVALTALLAAACVPKARYEDLQSQYDAEVQKVQDQQQRIQKLEGIIERNRAQAQKRLEAYRELVKEFKPLVDRGILDIKVEDGRIMLGMAADVLFPSGSAALSKQGRQNIAEVARILARRSEREFQVEGHTDSDDIQTAEFPSNWHLGAARAINVVAFMIDNGMDGDQLSAASFADTRPVAPNDTAAHKALNRRIEIVLLPDLAELPGYDELMEAGKPGPEDRPRRKPRKRRRRPRRK